MWTIVGRGPRTQRPKMKMDVKDKCEYKGRNEINVEETG